MSRPNFVTYLFGNGVSFFLISIALLAFGYQYFTTGQGGILALLCLVAGSYAYKANERIRAYNDWQREWNAMNGVPASSFVMPNLSGFRVVLGVGIWIVMAFAALSSAGTPGLEIPLFMFWLGTGLGVVVAVRRLLKGRAARPRKGDGLVQISVNTPGASPSLNQAYSALPDYCQRIIR